MPDSKAPHPPDAADDKLLVVPFSRDTALKTSKVTFPAAVHANNGHLIRPCDGLFAYVQLELDVSRLNNVHHLLWLAGLTRPARPLHRQELIGREIIVTEQADLHLVWLKSRIFIKPLPAFLLHYDSWAEFGHRHDVHQYACGLLYSYTWLISRESDLRRAHKIGLLPKDVTWERWTAFVTDFLGHVDAGFPGIVNQRYMYGELRLTRLNWIFRVRSIRERRVRSFRVGFFQGPDWFTQFLRDNFGWLIVVFGYTAIVLNAMQVGLATSRLSQNDEYQNASYGFSVFAIIMPVIVVGLVLLVSALTAMYNVQATLRYVREVERGSKRWDKPSGNQA